jgi:hypothetical protein
MPAHLDARAPTRVAPRDRQHARDAGRGPRRGRRRRLHARRGRALGSRLGPGGCSGGLLLLLLGLVPALGRLEGEEGRDLVPPGRLVQHAGPCRGLGFRGGLGFRI